MPTHDDGCNDGLLAEERKDGEFNQPRPTRTVFLPWVLTTFFLGTTCWFAWQSRWTPAYERCNSPSVNGTYETGYMTDFVSERPEIDIKIIQKFFTNDLRFNVTSKELYNDPRGSDETKYIGLPGDDIDAAWHDLLHNQYVAITPDEAAQFPEQDRIPIDYEHAKHYHFELSVFHNLHCLNEIRRKIDHDYYSTGTPHFDGDVLDTRVHIDHCIDQIRQALQCHADLTPVPMLPVEGQPFVLGNGEVHTCRDFDRVRDWVRERALRMKALGD